MRRLLPAVLAVVCGFGSGAGAVLAQEVRITEDMASVGFSVAGRDHLIARNQDTSNRIPDALSLTSRPCPGFCIQPIEAAPGVRTLGELEVIAHLRDKVSEGAALLIDARLPERFGSGAIPGAVNVPQSVIAPTNSYRGEIFEALGARSTGAGFDFTDALDLVVYCEGPWSGEAAGMIRLLVDAGYPPHKLGFYRGGMQSWQGLGLGVSTLANGG